MWAHPASLGLLSRHAAQTLNKNRFGWLLNFEAVLSAAFATVAQNVLNDSETFQKVRHQVTSSPLTTKCARLPPIIRIYQQS